MKNTVWILTRSHNDYSQHGEYFVKAFREKPSRKELLSADGVKEYEPDAPDWCREGDVDDILSDKGRVHMCHDVWYDLVEVAF